MDGPNVSLLGAATVLDPLMAAGLRGFAFGVGSLSPGHRARPGPKQGRFSFAPSDLNLITALLVVLALMVTRNMNQALKLGNRLIMLHRGRIIPDIQGEEKRTLRKEDLVARIYDHQKEHMSTDRMPLG